MAGKRAESKVNRVHQVDERRTLFRKTGLTYFESWNDDLGWADAVGRCWCWPRRRW